MKLTILNTGVSWFGTRFIFDAGVWLTALMTKLTTFYNITFQMLMISFGPVSD